jgi:hypothetical protein
MKVMLAVDGSSCSVEVVRCAHTPLTVEKIAPLKEKN